ncbi:sensor histidine kinase [Granulosicoccus sp. 3-233]|uniref:sensor histidine kinase n=1 Tax=Granulosicoccus sp. 3-233 TaxID=3417969 RepID=UPI003D350497
MIDAGFRWRTNGNGQLALPAAVCLVGLILTAFAVNTVYRNIHRERMEEFARRSDVLASRIGDALENQKLLLRGVRSLHEGAEYVSRRDFQAYLESIDLENSFPEVFAVGWVPRVPHHILHEFIRSVRSDRSIDDQGYPDFTLKPDADRYAAEHHVLTYLHPMEGKRWMLGYDLTFSAERLLTLEQARDSGEFAMSPPLVMTREEPTAKGFLLMLPTYGDVEPENLAQRRQHYRGMLLGIFRHEKLLEPFALDQFTAVAIRDITDARGAEDTASIQPFYQDGQTVSGASTLFRRIKGGGGREWQLAVSLGPHALAQLKSSAQLWLIAICALAITALAGFCTGRLVASRNRALHRTGILSGDLRFARQRLQRSDDELRHFAHVTSHDLQLSVRNVDLSVTLLENVLNTRMTSPVRENLDQLHAASSRLHKLADDLHDLARIGRENRQFECVDLNQVFALVQARLAPLIEEAQASIDIGSLPQLAGDRLQLELLVHKLMSNAIQYRSRARSLTIRIEARLIDAQWQITVADNGIGIAERFHDKVFEPFQRLHQHDDIVGTGLGLHICRQIAECHAGQIGIVSSSEAGSTFAICLPANEVSLDKAA